MRHINQSNYLALLVILTGGVYFSFVQKELVNNTETIPSICLEKNGNNPALCISCISRSKMDISSESSIYINDNRK